MTDTSLVLDIIARENASQTFDDVKGKALVAGAAIGVALGAGLVAAFEKNKADALLAAQLGAGPEMAKEFGKVSGHLYAQGFGETATDVNNALKSVWQNGLVDEDAAAADIEKVTSLVMTAAQLMEEDTGRVSAAVSNMLKTGMAKSAEEALDVITRGVQQGVNKSEDLLDTFNEYSTQFRKLGLDGPKALGLINQMMRAGARDSDVAADALKEFSIRAIDGSKATSNAYRDLGLDAKQMTDQIAQGGPAAEAGLNLVLERLKAMKDPAAQAAAAVGLFGTQSEDLGQALYAMDLGTAAAGLGDVAGAAQKASDAIGGSAAAKLEVFKRAVEHAFVETAAKAIPYLEKVVGWLSRHDELIGPLVAALTGLAIAIGVVTLATKAWAAAQAVVDALIAVSPLGWVLITLAALALAVYLLVANWEKVKAALVAGWDAVMEFFTATLPGWWDKLVGWAKELPGKVAAGLAALPGLVWDLFAAAMTKAAYLVGWGVGQVLHFWVSLPGWVWEALKALPGLLWGVMQWAWRTAVDATTWGVRTLVSAVMNLPGWLWEAGVAAVRGLINGVRSMAGKLRDLAVDMAKGFLKGFKDALGIHSPSTVFFKVATEGIGGGLLGGIDKVTGTVGARAQGLAQATLAPLAAGAARAPAAAAGAAGLPATVEVRGSGPLRDLIQRMFRDGDLRLVVDSGGRVAVAG